MKRDKILAKTYPTKPTSWSIAKRTLCKVAIALSVGLNVSHAQTFTYGLVVGTALTNDFGKRTLFSINPVTGNIDTFTETPASRGFIIGGGLVEWHISPRVSFEADALYRALHYNETQRGPRDTVVTWELPILFKYSFKQRAGLHPFVAIGPGFRTAGNLNSTLPSNTGVSAGAGLGIHFRFLDVAPVLRYTRWQSDKGLYRTKSDQLELLINFTHTHTSSKLSSGQSKP